MVQESDALAVGDLSDDVEGIALHPMPHVDGNALLAHLRETSREDVGALIDVGLVRDQRCHRIRALKLSARARMALDGTIREEIPATGCHPDVVP
ncbi:hypothetical protein RRF57_005006 [Xylaria bambusicola]|uniref:Uncharacterized protein n=1 Tax=Xylaria bambusicola TaxID=326684 RepID=A0AAN7UPS0_9PEZI